MSYQTVSTLPREWGCRQRLSHSGLLSQSRVREVLGEVAGELVGKFGDILQVREFSEALGTSDSLPAKRRICLHFLGKTMRTAEKIHLTQWLERKISREIVAFILGFTQPLQASAAMFSDLNFKGRQTGGGVQTGGFPDLDLFVLFCPFFFPFCDFPDFSGICPICSGMVRGFSRFVPFLFLGLLRAPTRNSPERVRDTIRTFPEKSGKPPGLEAPRSSFSQ